MKKILLLIAIFFSFIIIVSLFGCKSEQWAMKKIAKIEANQPAVLFNYCGDRFPPMVVDSSRTEYIKGETSWRYDTVTVDCDSVISSSKKDSSKLRSPNIVRIPCPPCPISVDTFKYYKFKAQENGAKAAALTIERDKAILSEQKQLQGRKIWMWIAIGLMAYTVIRWVLKAWLKITLP